MAGENRIKVNAEFRAFSMNTGQPDFADSSGSSTADTIERLKRLAEEYDVDFIEQITEDMLAPELVANVPVEWARAKNVLPARINGVEAILTSDPTDLSSIEYMNLLTGRSLRVFVAPPSAIASSIELCYYRKEHSPEDFMKEIKTPENGKNLRTQSTTDDLLKVIEEAPVTQLVNLTLLDAVKSRASDIHFEPFESRFRIRYRIDGVLYEQPSPPRHIEDALISRLKIMAKIDIAEKRLPQDGMTRVKVGDREIDIRVSTVPVAEGERVVLRLLDKESSLLPLTSLGMSETVLNKFNSLLKETNGIIIVSGPTGSGKTTTLYASLQSLDATRRNIMTIEDPIEYQLQNIAQIQVKPKIGLTFANGLRHILRQDPDVILVGEIRDLETAEISIRASLTGHLVFSTLHTNDAPGAVMRLVDMGVERYLVAECLKAVLAQRLVRKLCTSCKRPVALDQNTRKQLGQLATKLAVDRVYEPAGCSKCLEGYRGRTGIFELMTISNELRELIRSGELSGIMLRNTAEQMGMKGLLEDGLSKVRDGITSIAEILALGLTV